VLQIPRRTLTASSTLLHHASETLIVIERLYIVFGPANAPPQFKEKQVQGRSLAQRTVQG
jgi:hypothetical protein